MRTRAILAAVLVVLMGAISIVGVSASRAAAVNLTERFSREVVRYGDADTSPYHIDHVYELQYRLKRLGLFTATPTGYFGTVTLAAVKQFQRRIGVSPTGVVRSSTWKPLIKKTVRGLKTMPSACRSSGWHACYDRWWHQVSLFHDGKLQNSWLVRGGASTTPTRTGDYVVYYRDIDHYSSVYHTPMPYAQFFNGGQALHGSRLMMDPFVGHSHGCVNFWVEDAKQLWNLTSTKTLHVHVFGDWS